MGKKLYPTAFLLTTLTEIVTVTNSQPKVDLSHVPSDAIIGYHWTGRLLRDGSPVPPVGAVLTHTGPVVLCESGLHASRTPWQALQYASGAVLHRVALWGDVEEDKDDKLVARNRAILASLDAAALLRRFACDEALQVLPLDASQSVRDYLTNPTEAACESAWEAACESAWEAAWKSAWEAGRKAAWKAARKSAWEAAWEAAQEAAWEAARLRQYTEFNSRCYAALGD